MFNTLHTSKYTPDPQSHHQNYPTAQDGARTFCGSGHSQCGNLCFLEKIYEKKNTMCWSVSVRPLQTCKILNDKILYIFMKVECNDFLILCLTLLSSVH